MAFTTERIHYLIRSAQEKRNGSILEAHQAINKAHEDYSTELERMLISSAVDADHAQVSIEAKDYMGPITK